LDILKKINKEKLIAWRRHFHMYPEIAYQEFESQQYILDQLKAYPELEVHTPAGTSVVAVLKAAKPGKVVGLRADFDALPIEETADVPFKSKNPGKMHACGHDFHAAMLLGAVDTLYAMKDELCGTIKFIFQHAEEVEPGGAIEIVNSGILDDVEAFYGAHVSAGDACGVIAAASGPIYAAADVFEINISGKGGHAARPDATIDTLLVGTEIVQALNYIVSRNVPSINRSVLTVGMFRAGSAFNIIPDTAEIQGTVRTYNAETRALITRRIHEITDNICAAYGATASVVYNNGYEPVYNDEYLYEVFKKTVQAYLPETTLEKFEPIMGGEDFSAYKKIAPIFFAGVGAKDEAAEPVGHHNPRLILNEGCLPIGCALYVTMAMALGK